MEGETAKRLDTEFERFFGEEYPRCVRFVTALSGRRALAEEIAQEALFAAFRQWNKVASLDRPDLWVRRAAVNRAISLHRRLVAEVSALGRLGAQRTLDVAASEPRDDALWAAVERLSARQAAAIVLSIEGFTASEIGRVLRCSEETAQTHLRRARAKLAQELQEVDHVA